MADHVQVPAYLIFAFCLGALHFEDYQFYYAAIKTTIQLVTSVGCLHEKVDPLSFPKDVNNLLGASREHLISNRSADSTQSRRRSSPFCAFSQVPSQDGHRHSNVFAKSTLSPSLRRDANELVYLLLSSTAEFYRGDF